MGAFFYISQYPQALKRYFLKLRPSKDSNTANEVWRLFYSFGVEKLKVICLYVGVKEVAVTMSDGWFLFFTLNNGVSLGLFDVREFCVVKGFKYSLALSKY